MPSPPLSPYPPQPQYPAQGPQQGPPQGSGVFPHQSHPEYEQPIQDMGTSLGYGQGMEYQYFNAPQPSQPLPMLRQTRLQQLRAERMRRQQGGQRDLTNTMQGGQEQAARPAAPFKQPFGAPTTPPFASNAAPTSQSLYWETLPPDLPETPLAASLNVEDMPTTPIAPRGPAGMLSLPSRPLPAVSPGAPGMLTSRPVQKQDTGSMQKLMMAR